MASAATRLPAEAVFAGRSRSVTVSVNGRSPLARYGAGTEPVISPFGRATTSSRTGTPSIETITTAPGVKPWARTTTFSRDVSSTER
jgi:hypothetical protein